MDEVALGTFFRGMFPDLDSFEYRRLRILTLKYSTITGKEKKFKKLERAVVYGEMWYNMENDGG